MADVEHLWCVFKINNQPSPVLRLQLSQLDDWWSGKRAARFLKTRRRQSLCFVFRLELEFHKSLWGIASSRCNWKKCKNHQNLNFIGFWRRTCYTIFWRSRKSFAYFAPHIPRWSYMEGGQWNKTDILSEVNNCLGLGALLVGHKFRTLLSESGGYRTFLSVIAVHSRWG